jgi:hypothetical protein
VYSALDSPIFSLYHHLYYYPFTNDSSRPHQAVNIFIFTSAVHLPDQTSKEGELRSGCALLEVGEGSKRSRREAHGCIIVYDLRSPRPDFGISYLRDVYAPLAIRERDVVDLGTAVPRTFRLVNVDSTSSSRLAERYAGSFANPYPSSCERQKLYVCTGEGYDELMNGHITMPWYQVRPKLIDCENRSCRLQLGTSLSPPFLGQQLATVSKHALSVPQHIHGIDHSKQRC